MESCAFSDVSSAATMARAAHWWGLRGTKDASSSARVEARPRARVSSNFDNTSSTRVEARPNSLDARRSEAESVWLVEKEVGREHASREMGQYSGVDVRTAIGLDAPPRGLHGLGPLRGHGLAPHGLALLGVLGLLGFLHRPVARRLLLEPLLPQEPLELLEGRGELLALQRPGRARVEAPEIRFPVREEPAREVPVPGIAASNDAVASSTRVERQSFWIHPAP